jgi:polysaccharide export outer membrane protein
MFRIKMALFPLIPDFTFMKEKDITAYSLPGQTTIIYTSDKITFTAKSFNQDNNMRKKIVFRLCIQAIPLALCICILNSCASSKRINTNYIYFKDGADTVIAQQKEVIIQPKDLLSIQVFSRTLNQEQAAIFNIPIAAGGNAGMGNGQVQMQGYQVNTNGNLEMPVIGSVKAAGLTKDQLQASLVTKLTDYVKNPGVLIRFLQFNINVLGEVRTPGTQKFQSDKVTIIDALGAAGDLTDYGNREDIKVIREEAGKRITYTIDLRNKTVFESPVYMLQPNDIVYVSPTKYKLRNLSIDPDTQRKTTIFFSVLTTIVGVATLVVFAVRN